MLEKINEALKFGFSSLRNHLLLMINLYIDDLQDGMFLASRNEHVLVHETKPERSHAFDDGDG